MDRPLAAHFQFARRDKFIKKVIDKFPKINDKHENYLQS